MVVLARGLEPLHFFRSDAWASLGWADVGCVGSDVCGMWDGRKINSRFWAWPRVE